MLPALLLTDCPDRSIMKLLEYFKYDPSFRGATEGGFFIENFHLQGGYLRIPLTAAES